MKPAQLRAIAGLTTAVAAGSCASTPPGTGPHDMSAADHRKHAMSEEALADAHEAQHDPDARSEAAMGRPDSEFSYAVVTYNPTGHHLDDAAKHRQHGAAHREAARALEQFEEGECGNFPPETRSVCPLLGQVAAADNLPDGVRITVAEGVNQEALVAHTRCHLAFAATQGFEGMDACPLYVKGVALEAADGVLLLKTEDPAALRAVQARTATHVK